MDPYQRPDEDSPNRCQAVTSNGQCPLVAVPDSKNCIAHGGVHSQKAAEKRRISSYNIAKWQVKINQHSQSPALKGLHDEIGILRMMLESRLNQCNDASDLLMHHGPIADLISKIEKTVVSFNKLEASLGNHIDKAQLIQFAGQVVQIIGENIGDSDTLDKISSDILGILDE